MDIFAATNQFEISLPEKRTRVHFFRFFLLGLLLPLSFAPFHIPGIAILAMALFYHQLMTHQQSPFWQGLAFGLGYFGFGVSWVMVSIHEYGHLNPFLAALITLLFILYLSLFPALMASIFSKGKGKPFTLFSGLTFSAFWVLCEYGRSSFLTGFPWLLLGFGQFDAPTKYLLPIIGVYGLGFLTCFAAALLVISFKRQGIKRVQFLALGLILLLSPGLMKNKQWGKMDATPLSVGIIQANMSMRDKWDERLFWTMLKRYQENTRQLLGTQLIVMPESAIPVPATYISDALDSMNQDAKKAGSAILLGIPKATNNNEDQFYNTMIALGQARGSYLKQHIVPFGEYMPKPFLPLTNWLDIADANLKAGKSGQPLIRVHQQPIASLICYELAYGDLLRKQLPEAKWIVSINDDGWFGHSLAVYQHQQMAQVLSLQASRYQVIANNDGLSAVINQQGDIVSGLPAFSEGILKAALYPMTGSTPWIVFGDTPVLLCSALIALLFLLFNRTKLETIAAKHKRRYPYQPV